jgi:hypothetical protein
MTTLIYGEGLARKYCRGLGWSLGPEHTLERCGETVTLIAGGLLSIKADTR